MFYDLTCLFEFFTNTFKNLRKFKILFMKAHIIRLKSSTFISQKQLEICENSITGFVWFCMFNSKQICVQCRT